MTSEPPPGFGPYRIVRVLGEGGMGVVYLAEQVEPVTRLVALKLLKEGTASEQILRRFEAERQTLARMDHPSIAKIHDAGVTDRGLPYFAMEYVPGETLAAFCDRQRLTVRQRVQLFVEVCNGIQHAHQKGIIHRDLKSSNILVSEVDGRPLPRIIDFGVATAIRSDDFDGARLTRADQMIGTPAYMSPEQIDGSADIDTRTDVYALGVLLYEILVGALPFDTDAYRGWAAVASQLSRDTPSPARRLTELSDRAESIAASRSTDLSTLRRQLRGDLGWIVARAMEKDRDERYETVNAMALDLKRHLSDEPIRARGATTAYVVAKFVRRNRWGVAFGTTVAAGLIGFAIMTAVQADRVAAARDVAEARRTQAEGLIDFMLSDLRSDLEDVGRLEILDDVGDEAITYFASLPEEEFSDEELLRRSQALYQIGDVRIRQGRSTEAADAFLESLRLSIELTERDPDNDEWLFGRSQSHFWVGYAEWLQRDLEAAEAQFQEYMRIAQELVLRDDTNDAWRLELAYAHSNLGSVREERRDLEGALESLQANLDISRGLAAANPDEPAWASELAIAHNKVGVVLQKLGALEGAREEFAANLQIMEALVRADPSSTRLDDLGLSHQYLGEVLRLQGQPAAALDHHRAQVEIVEDLVRLDPENIEWASSLAIARRNAGHALLDLGDPGAARDLAHDSKTLFDDLAERDPDRIRFPRGSARALWLRGRALALQDRSPEALADARASVTMLERVRDQFAEDERTAVWLAESRLLVGDLLAADDAASAAIAWAAALDELAADVGQADVIELRARALQRLGRTDEASALVSRLADAGYGRLDPAR